LVYASTFSSGEAGIVLINTSNISQTVKLNLSNFQTGKRYYLYTLVGGTDNGEFSQQVFVNGKGPEYRAGGPKDIEKIKAYAITIKKEILIDAPPRSVQYIMVERK
jgi:hypothetical protein